jgi:hypothetical protein
MHVFQVSCFQYNASAYLVLEYASAGDLHTLLVSAGKLAHSQTRLGTIILYRIVWKCIEDDSLPHIQYMWI